MENKHQCGCEHDNELEQEDHNCGCGCGEEGDCDDCCCHHEDDNWDDGDHQCGCGHNHHHPEEEYETIRLMLEDDRELECFVLDIFPIENQEYIALLPKGEENVLIYRYNEGTENDGPQLSNIEDDEEFQRVSDLFIAIMDGDYEEDEDEITE